MIYLRLLKCSPEEFDRKFSPCWLTELTENQAWLILNECVYNVNKNIQTHIFIAFS